MIKTVTVTNHMGDSMILDLLRPEKSGFIVSKITGLGPVKTDINMTQLTSSDGAFYNSARTGVRNIVISLEFMFAPTIEQVRLKAYKYFPVKKPITLIIETDNRISKITGFVETNEPDIFSKKQGTNISILCPYPYFYSAGTNGIHETMFSGNMPMLEFPFENASLTNKLIQLSSVERRREYVVVNDGDADVGVTIIIDILNESFIGTITIANSQTGEKMIINSKNSPLTPGDISDYSDGIPFRKSDEIIINTTKNNKSVEYITGGIKLNGFNAIDWSSNWFQLSSGDNLFAYSTSNGKEENIMFRVLNQIVYSGV